MALHFITYADDAFRENADGLVESALRVGFASGRRLSPADISETPFYKKFRDIFSERRGAGFWLWKPYIILEEVKRLKEGDCLFYSDAGRSSYYRFDSYPKNLQRSVRGNEHGFLLGSAIPHLGSLKHWTKRDCLLLMNSDSVPMLDRSLILTSPSLWTKTESSLSFLEKWLMACSDRRCLTDDPNVCGFPNHEEFKDHRHDQSIMTILAYQNNAPFLDFHGTFVQKLIEMRPGSSLAHNFYKRPQNVNDLIARDAPWLLVREFLKLRKIQ